MAQDLRKMFESNREQPDRKIELKAGHENRFMARLERELPLTKRVVSIKWYALAASIAVLLSLGIYFHTSTTEENGPIKTTVVDKETLDESGSGISLGDLSPDLKKVENYYVANINLALSKLEVSPENKALVDSFMDQLSLLDIEYKNLNKELNTIGPNDQTINALIKNLQLRLQLLQKLKMKLNDLKSSNNEPIETNAI
ncbi:MAG: hypothetical protein WBN39_04200 [Flavobacteriaceae bacterium]